MSSTAGGPVPQRPPADGVPLDTATTAPALAPGAWVAAGATLVGDVRLGDGSSVWYGTVLRADGDRIEVGAGSNVQDGCVAHADPGLPVVLGAGVSVGHGALLHGCTVEDDVLVGMGAVLLDDCHIGAGSVVAAGTVVLAGARVPPRSLVAGVPGVVRRSTSDEEVDGIRGNASTYRDLVERHASGRVPVLRGGPR